MNYISKLVFNSLRYRRPIYLFSKKENPYHVYTEKVMQMISDLSEERTPTIEPVHINNVIKNIIYVEPNKRESVLKFLLASLYGRTVDMELLQLEELQKCVKFYPVTRIQLNIHIINQLKKGKQSGKNISDKTINDKFLECFEEILPSIKNQYDQMRVRTLLYKNFGKYLIEQKLQEKGTETLEQSIYEHKKLITNYSRKLEEERKDEDESEASRQVKLNAIKENIRKIIESMFETMYFYYVAQRQSFKVSTQKHQKEIILYTLALIKECMQVKLLVPGIKHFSMFYHKLRKIQFELQLLLLKRAGDTKKIDELLKQMNSFQKESLDDLVKAKDYLSIMKEIALTVISLRFHIAVHEKKENLKEELVACSEQIINHLQSQYQKPILKVLGEFIKANVPQ